MKEFIKELKNNAAIKNIFILLCCSLLLRLLFTLCNIFEEYLYIIEFINWRLFIILCIIVSLKGLLNLPFVKDLQEEMSIFNEGPANKSSFIAYLRKYHFTLLFFGYFLHILAVTYFVKEPLISYSLGLIAFVSLILYLVQFLVYTVSYVRKSSKSNKSFLKGKIGYRTITTHPGVKRVLTVCLECSKTVVAVGFVADGSWKLINGYNDVPPWRQYILNKKFPDDETKIWTETKAALALHNRAMGRPHDGIYDTIGEKIKKAAPKDDSVSDKYDIDKILKDLPKDKYDIDKILKDLPKDKYDSVIDKIMKDLPKDKYDSVIDKIMKDLPKDKYDSVSDKIMKDTPKEK